MYLWSNEDSKGICCFSLFITLFPSPITQNWWVHGCLVCLDLFSVFVFITQFSSFWVMSYINWKYILDIFKLSKLSYWGIVVNFWTYVGPTIMLCLYQVSPPQPLPTSLSLFFLLICISISLSEPIASVETQQEHLKPNSSNWNPTASTKIWCCVIFFFNKVFFDKCLRSFYSIFLFLLFFTHFFS